jgi:hypothetical protein
VTDKKKQKPEEATSGFLVELQQTTRKLKNNYPSLYYVFWMFARPETYLFYFYVKFAVVGVNVFSISVRVVGGGRLTVVMNAVLLKDVVHTEMPKKNTVKLKKEKLPIVRPKHGVENGNRKKIWRIWMIGLQHQYPQGVICHHCIQKLLLRLKIFMGEAGLVKRGVVIFVDFRGQSWIDFHVEAMATRITSLK